MVAQLVSPVKDILPLRVNVATLQGGAVQLRGHVVAFDVIE
jgi:hypothetical protein